MIHKSLEEVLQAAGNPVDLLRNSRTGPYVYPVVNSEYSNWRDEQRAWQQACVLFNQSYHMSDMYVQGPDALKLLSDTGINSFKNFEPDKAKQFVPCNYDGYVIGDVILFYLEKDLFNLVGRPSVHNWVQYQGETGKYNVKFERDERAERKPRGQRARAQRAHSPIGVGEHQREQAAECRAVSSRGDHSPEWHTVKENGNHDGCRESGERGDPGRLPANAQQE